MTPARKSAKSEVISISRRFIKECTPETALWRREAIRSQLHAFQLLAIAMGWKDIERLLADWHADFLAEEQRFGLERQGNMPPYHVGGNPSDSECATTRLD
jgi:hypothetical protein